MLRAYLWVASAVPVASPGQVSPVLPSCGEASGSIVGPPFKQRWKLETGERVAPPCAGWASTASFFCAGGWDSGFENKPTYIYMAGSGNTRLYTNTRQHVCGLAMPNFTFCISPCPNPTCHLHITYKQLVYLIKSMALVVKVYIDMPQTGTRFYQPRQLPESTSK